MARTMQTSKKDKSDEEKNAQGMVIEEAELTGEEEEEDEDLGSSNEETNGEEQNAAKRKETCSNSVTAGTPLQLQGQQFNVTVEERDNTLVLDAEMPMLNIETLVMAVDDDHSLLTISGEKISPSRKRARIEKTNNVLVEEINNTMYVRKVEIPQGYDINHVSTTYKDGALTITFKKKVEKNPSTPRTHVIPNPRKRVCIVQ